MAEALGAAARLRARVAERGLAATLLKFAGDHLFRLSTSVVMEYRPEWQTPAALRLPAGVTTLAVRAGTPPPPLCAWLAPRAGDFSAMLAAGKLGLFVLRDGVAVGCAWVSLADHHDRVSREFYRVPAGEAYHYCWLVDPAERSRGMAMLLVRYGLYQMRALGIRRQFGVVDRVNTASYRVQQHFGYRECGTKVFHLYLLGTRWTFTARYRGTLGPAAVRGAARTLRPLRARPSERRA